jgi:C-terminal processing protease CtpA/Prc
MLMLVIAVVLLQMPSFCFANNMFSVEINDVDSKPVADLLLKDLVGRGYQILSTSEYQVAVRKDVDNFWQQVFFGSQFNTVPEMRAYFNLVPSGSKLLVTLEVKIVTNPNSGFEKYSNVTNKEWQEYLYGIKKYFNGYVGYGISWDKKKQENCLKVTSITADGPADKAGLKVGDLISKVKGSSVEDLKMSKVNEIFHEGEAGTTLLVTLKKPLKDKDVMMTKDFILPIYQKPVTPLTPNKVNKAVFGFTNGEVDLEGNMLILAITPGSSADRAGIKVGDKILRINGILVSEYTPDRFNAAFAGGEGAKVELTIAVHGGESEKTVTIVKTYIIQKSEL